MADWHLNENSPAPGDDAGTAGGAVDAEPQAIASELKRLGAVLAAAVKAASQTPEAQSLRNELRSGSQAMVREFDDVAAETRAAATRVTSEYRSAGVGKLRADVAGALRALNRSLEDLADGLSAGKGTDESGPRSSAGADQTPETRGVEPPSGE